MLTSEMKVAILRGVFQAFLQFGGLFMTTYIATDDLKAGFLAGGLAAFVALGFRSAEGQYDTVRNISLENKRAREKAPYHPNDPNTW